MDYYSVLAPLMSLRDRVSHGNKRGSKTQEVPRDLGAWCQEPWAETKCEFLTSPESSQNHVRRLLVAIAPHRWPVPAWGHSS